MDLSRSDRARLLRALAEVFHMPERIDGVLDDIGLGHGDRPQGNPEMVWRAVLHELEQGEIEDGVRVLVEACLERYPFNPVFRDLNERYPRGSVPDSGTEATGGRGETGSDERQVDPPNPAHCRLFVRVSTEEERRKILTMLAAFTPTVDFATNVVTRYTLNVADPAPVRQRLEHSDLHWTIVGPDGPDHLLSSLIVQGPDGRNFRFTDTPAATPVADIADGTLARYPDDSGTRIAVTDLVDDDGQDVRLPPDTTLADAGVRDGARLRIGYQTSPGEPPSARGHVVLAVATEWSSGRGGLSSYNRRLCAALAAHPAVARVFCQIPSDVDDSDRLDAKTLGVELIDSEGDPDLPPQAVLHLEPRLPDAVTPDLVIGHSRITGYAARRQASRLPGARRAHLVHMAPDEIDWEKPSPSLAITESRTEAELELGETASVVGAVGRRTFNRFQRDLPVSSTVVQLDPGFRDLGQHRRGLAATPKVLFFGRLEDAWLKGVDIAARAMARAALRLRQSNPEIDEIELLVRGATDRESTNLRETILSAAAEAAPGAHHPYSVTPRLYTTSTARLERDLRTSSLVLMPSRVEAFGLVGVEAIEHGTPVLVSETSGLAAYLRASLQTADAAQTVVDSPSGGGDVADEWGFRIWNVLCAPQASLERAERIRKRVVADRPWSKVAGELLEAFARSS